MSMTATTKQMVAQSNEHRRNICRILLFVAKYREVKGIVEFKELKIPVADRDGTTHEMLFDFLVNVRPFSGEDWRLVVEYPEFAADAVYHIEHDEYEGKNEILVAWRESFAQP